MRRSLARAGLEHRSDDIASIMAQHLARYHEVRHAYQQALALVPAYGVGRGRVRAARPVVCRAAGIRPRGWSSCGGADLPPGGDHGAAGPRQKVPDPTVPLRFAAAIRITGPAA